MNNREYGIGERVDVKINSKVVSVKIVECLGKTMASPDENTYSVFLNGKIKIVKESQIDC